MHLDLAKLMPTEMINGNYEESISIYDKFQAEVMTMANIMAKGVIRQFWSWGSCYL